MNSVDWTKRAEEHENLARYFSQAGNEVRASVHRKLAQEHLARASGKAA